MDAELFPSLTAGAAMEELQEADILWPDSDDHRSNNDDVDGNMVIIHAPSVLPKVSPELSSPAHVPCRKRRSRSWTSEHVTSDQTIGSDDDDEDVGCDDDAKRTMNGIVVVPPHVLVERRRLGGRTAAYSMCAGKGRTLKGRDLRNVRNLALRMTGFIEK